MVTRHTMRRRYRVIRAGSVAAFTALVLAVAPVAIAHHGPPYADGEEHDFGEMVDYPLVFPVDGTYYFYDTFDSSRCCDPGEIHHAQDIMSPKMTPVVAAASGTIKYVNWSRDPDPGPPDPSCCTLAIDHDDGWESWYIHLNNDTPGTDDGQGWGIAPGIAPGVHVQAGQLIGWVGDSGNAENVSSHLHYELKDPEDIIVNPFEALVAAEANGPIPRCDGLPVTLFAVAGEPLYGTDGDDVILGSDGADEIYAGEGDDVVCGLGGRDHIDGGPGSDRLLGGDEKDHIFGGDGSDRILPGEGHDRVRGGKGRDTVVVEGSRNRIRGGGGNDWVDYSLHEFGVTIDLSAGRAAGDDLLFSVEHVIGSPYDDRIIGSDGSNKLKGISGSDELFGRGGDDRLKGGGGTDTADGGDGFDTCNAETVTACGA